MLAALTLQLLHGHPGCQNVFARLGHTSCLLQHSSGLWQAHATGLTWHFPHVGIQLPFQLSPEFCCDHNQCQREGRKI